ncbi:hypothetical protein TVAG_270810 [Trichomonas vaginalis G3]|uniref:Uncharacterized protein n=1 Tax=Trichomonas vaginalis (strain ATCC PRA-98 / G3) TaxID=412133 RepID=A2FIH3_TRIV3|nr:hypothetical protein TVAGG3_0014800 [Trichomonas vaginalis G3]EAX95290.1 hypothetical protein TVAG_270810 [Trichomonas vaginalis G3]KAI5539347.1 hypothetical protein TVAGG3_0014800 [Trichomonas vaginalis G3]|eukprot:XP_001308220.1 hypothetical protein [Trichomonas vaginalis G3]
MERFANVERSLNELRMLILNYAEGNILESDKTPEISFEEEETQSNSSESIQSIASLPKSPRSSPRPKSTQKSPQQEISSKFETFLEKKYSQSPQSSPRRESFDTWKKQLLKGQKSSSASKTSSSIIEDYVSPEASDSSNSSLPSNGVNSSQAVGFENNSDNEDLQIQTSKQNSKLKVDKIDTKPNRQSLPPISPIPRNSKSIPSSTSSSNAIEISSSSKQDQPSDLTPLSSVENIIEDDPQMGQFKEKLELSFQAKSPHSAKAPKSELSDSNSGSIKSNSDSNNQSSNEEESQSLDNDSKSLNVPISSSSDKCQSFDDEEEKDELDSHDSKSGEESSEKAETYQLELPEEEEESQEHEDDHEESTDPELEALKEHLEKTNLTKDPSANEFQHSSHEISDPFNIKKVINEEEDELGSPEPLPDPKDISDDTESFGKSFDEKLNEFLNSHDSLDSYDYEDI